MEKINIGVIGLGSRGTDLLNTIMACEEVNIIGLSDKYEDRLENAIEIVKKNRGNTPKGYLNYHDLLANKDIKAVVIASSWDKHISMAIDSMKAGKCTAMEVGGAYDVQECWELVHTYEQTKTPFMLMENCCYDEFELLSTSLARAGKLGEIVNCHGAYCHDLRAQVIGGYVKRHYRIDNYMKRNCENYPTHELGPICKLLDVNRGNRMVSLVSVSSKARGIEEFSKMEKNPDKSLIGTKFMQGDVVNTIITCADGSTITLTLNTTLPRFYSREFTVNGTLGFCQQDGRIVYLDKDSEGEHYYITSKSVREYLDNADKYKAYLPEIWQNVTEEQLKLGHGGMDFFLLKAFFNACITGEEMPIDVYDAASWLAVTALSENSVATGGMPQFIPDFTKGAWLTRPRKDVVKFPKVEE